MDALQKEQLDLDYAIGDRVNTLMRRFGYSRKVMGGRLGVSPSAMSLKLSGKRAWSAMDVAIAAASVGVRAAVLYGEEPMPLPTRPGTVTELDVSKNAVGPTGLEPMTSTV